MRWLFALRAAELTFTHGSMDGKYRQMFTPNSCKCGGMTARVAIGKPFIRAHSNCKNNTSQLISKAACSFALAILKYDETIRFWTTDRDNSTLRVSFILD